MYPNPYFYYPPPYWSQKTPADALKTLLPVVKKPPQPVGALCGRCPSGTLFRTAGALSKHRRSAGCVRSGHTMPTEAPNVPFDMTATETPNVEMTATETPCMLARQFLRSLSRADLLAELPRWGVDACEDMDEIALIELALQAHTNSQVDPTKSHVESISQSHTEATIALSHIESLSQIESMSHIEPTKSHIQSMSHIQPTEPSPYEAMLNDSDRKRSLYDILAGISEGVLVLLERRPAVTNLPTMVNRATSTAMEKVNKFHKAVSTIQTTQVKTLHRGVSTIPSIPPIKKLHKGTSYETIAPKAALKQKVSKMLHNQVEPKAAKAPEKTKTEHKPNHMPEPKTAKAPKKTTHKPITKTCIIRARRSSRLAVHRRK